MRVLFRNITVYFLIILFIVSDVPGALTGLDLFDSGVYALNATMYVNFPESSSRSRSKTVTIPNLVRITSVTVDTGNVTYSVNGNQVTINVSKGKSTDSYTPSEYISNYTYYTGTATPPSSVYYSSGGYSGTLSLYNATNNGYYEIKESTKYFTKTVTNSRSWTKTQSGVVFGPWAKPDHGSYQEINEDGYKGSIPRLDTTYSPSDFSSYKVGDSGTQVATGYFGGYLTKTEFIWHDDWYGHYRGTIYGSTTYYYEYNVTIKYVSNIPPSINIINPAENQVFSGEVSSYIPTVSVSDSDGDTLACKLFLDSESSPRDTRTISNTATPQNISFAAQDIGQLAEGDHKMRFTVYDGEATVEKEISFKVDKTPPVAASVSFASTDTSISISGTATDNISMHAEPYRFRAGSAESQWTASSNHTFSNLVPNTQYTARFVARDKAGNMTEVAQDIYTKACRPSMSVGGARENSLVITMTDANPSDTEYLISCGAKYVTKHGTLSQSPEWIKLSGKTIEICDLDENTLYTFAAKARCFDGTETAQSEPASGRTLAPPPNVLRFEDVQQTQIKISWDAVNGATGYDIEADGFIHDNDTSVSYLHTGLSPETTHTYRVRVRNAGGTGNWSGEFSCATLMNRPGVPENISFTVQKTEITLSWDPVARAESYEVEVDGVIQDAGSNCSYTHYGLEPDSTHKYRIRAKNQGGAGEWSSYIEATTLPNPPGPPQSVNTEITKTTIKLIWEPVAKTDRYEIEVDGTIFDVGENTEYLHEGLVPLTTHKYRLRGINAGGTGEWSGYIYLTTHPYEPSVPGNVMATSDANSISLFWYMASFAYTYEIEVDGNIVDEVFSTNYKHENVTPGSRHTYRIRSKNISGVSDWTNPVTITASSTHTGQDMLVTNLAAVITYDSITLSWNSLSDDCQYDVEADGVIFDNAYNTVFNHTHLEPGTYHEYKIRARVGETAGEWSNVLSLSTLPMPPGAPAITRSHATSTSIQIWWEPVEDAVSYDVEADGVIITGITDITYLHDQLLPGTTHQYRVRARTLVDVSPWSEVYDKSTGSTVYIIDCTEGEVFDFSLLARNIQDFSDITFVVTYDSGQIEVVDLFGGTAQIDLTNEGQVPGTNIYAKYTPGRIEFKVNGSIVPGTSWSGEITNIVFRARKTCTAEISFTEE
jgi:hypothetical protein